MDPALLECTSWGALITVPADPGIIAEEVFWHRRHFHEALTRLDFLGALPADGSVGAITVSAGALVAEQWRHLAEWDTMIAQLDAAA